MKKRLQFDVDNSDFEMYDNLYGKSTIYILLRRFLKRVLSDKKLFQMIFFDIK